MLKIKAPDLRHRRQISDSRGKFQYHCPPMNKAQLVDKIATHTQTTKLQSEQFLDAALKVIQVAVSKGDEVKLVGFGTFTRSVRKGRQGRNPKTGAAVRIPDARVPRFKPGKEFKEQVR